MSPQYVNIVDAVKLFFSNYVNFKGRSTRSEYWWVILASFILGFVLGIFGGIMTAAKGGEPSTLFTVLFWLVEIALLVPSLSLCIRRLHDVGKTGWLLLLALVPIANLYLLYLYCQPSDGPNQWGDSADSKSY